MKNTSVTTTWTKTVSLQVNDNQEETPEDFIDDALESPQQTTSATHQPISDSARTMVDETQGETNFNYTDESGFQMALLGNLFRNWKT